MLISPTEPSEFRVLGEVSAVPEMYGADFLMFGPRIGRVGVQRKEIADFVASIRDDRLGTEVAQLRSLDVAMLILEGQVEYTNDGLLLGTRSALSRAQLLGTLWHLQSNGLWITCTNSKTDTIECLSLFTRWIAKARHTTLTARKGPRPNMYGTRGNEDWEIHVLQSFPGLGYERAKAVREFYGGLPLCWTGVLTDVPGIGDRLSRKLTSLLETGGAARSSAIDGRADRGGASGTGGDDG